jgi:hypothetical protein
MAEYHPASRTTAESNRTIDLIVIFVISVPFGCSADKKSREGQFRRFKGRWHVEKSCHDWRRARGQNVELVADCGEQGRRKVPHDQLHRAISSAAQIAMKQ